MVTNFANLSERGVQRSFLKRYFAGFWPVDLSFDLSHLGLGLGIDEEKS